MKFKLDLFCSNPNIVEKVPCEFYDDNVYHHKIHTELIFDILSFSQVIFFFSFLLYIQTNTLYYIKPHESYPQMTIFLIYTVIY